MQNKWSWSVAVMCYNEAPTLKETVNRLVGFFHSEGIEYDISIINDGSQDESLNIANHLASENPCIQVINFEKNKGVAEVLRCAYSQAANKDFLSIIPADLEFPP